MLSLALWEGIASLLGLLAGSRRILPCSRGVPGPERCFRTPDSE